MKNFKQCSFLMGALLIAGCMSRPQHDPYEVVEQSYVHKYGVPVPSQDWSAKGETGKVVSTLKSGVVVTRAYVNGVLEGETTYTFAHNDALEKVETYNQGQLVKERYFYKSGSPFKEIEHPSENTQIVKAFYEHGAPQFTEVYENELLQKGEYFTQTHTVDSTVDNYNGSRTRRDRFGILVGVDKVESGIVRETKTYHQDGSLQQIIPYKDGIVHGDLKTFYPGGEPESIQVWAYGEQTGPTTYFENGEKVSVQELVRGVKEGTERKYRNGEILVEEIAWSSDVRHGPTTTIINGVAKVDYFYKGQPVTRSAYEKLTLGTQSAPVKPR